MEAKIQIAKTDPIIIFNIIILISFGVILISSYFLISEIIDAKKACEEIEGFYKLVPFEHTCNNKTFVKYIYGSWDFEYEEIDLSDFNFSELLPSG